MLPSSQLTLEQSDFERDQHKVDSLTHKPKRTDRDNANLAKAEADLASTKEVSLNKATSQIPLLTRISDLSRRR